MTDSIAPEYIALQQAVLGRYSLERELGRGGMGIVFLARDVALDRLVAIKLLPPSLADRPGLRERFLREARTAAKLSQPNIVPIHAVEETSGLVFFVMSFVDGETLGERVRARGPLSPADGARVLQEVAWALAYAHGRGVVHRDVKPDNILMERDTGRAIVTDFGIAAATGGAGDVVGTAEYMSPEQAEGRPVDGRSDLYALGAVGFYALSGRHVFEARDARAVLAMHLAVPAPSVAAAVPGLPRRLADAIDRCLQKNLDDRPASGEVLAEMISLAAPRSKDLPAPVRAWVTKGQELRSLYTLYAGLVVVPMAGMVALTILRAVQGWEPMWHIAAAAGWLLGMGLIPVALHAVYRLIHTRRLLETGYGLEDLRLALRTWAERRREELAFDRDREPGWLAKTLRKVAWGGFASFVGLAGLTIAVPGVVEVLPGWAFAASFLTATVGGAISHTYPGIRLPARDEALERRSRWWEGRFGRWTVKVASLFLTPRAGAATLTYRPTELAISLAADALFEALPAPLQRQLPDLPAVVERLRSDARAMRATVGDLDAAIAALEDDGRAAQSTRLRAGDAGAEAEVLDRTRRSLRADLVIRRDMAAQRLTEALAGLETLRLDLLRLTAGSGSLAELTANLGAARTVGAEVERQIAGQQEVRSLLRSVRDALTGPTPRPS